MSDKKSLALTQLTADDLTALEDNRQLAEALTVDLEEIENEWAQGLGIEGRMALLFRMRTSIDPRFTLQEQADIFDRSIATVKRWAGTDEYVALAAELASPSRAEIISAARAALEEDLLPLSLQRLRELLTDEDTKGGTVLAAIKMIMSLTVGNTAPDSQDAHRRDAMEFLKGRGATINNTQIIINHAPAELADKVASAIPADYEEVIDAEE
jgi:hypothetical protein